MYVNMLVFSKDDETGAASNSTNIAELNDLTSIESILCKIEDRTQESDRLTNTATHYGSDTNIGTSDESSDSTSKIYRSSQITGGRKTGLIIAAALAILVIIIGIAVSSSNRSNNDYEYHGEDYIDPVYKDEGEVSNDARLFCSMAGGIWVDMDTVRQSEGSVMFDYLIIQNGTIATGSYPGEYSRSGRIVDAINYDDGTIELTVFYPEINNEQDGYCEQYTDKYVVELVGATLTLYNSRQWQFEYMGSTIDEAVDNLSDCGNYANYDEDLPFYGIWCAAYVSAEDAEVFIQNMQEHDFGGEVIITSDWECLNPTKYYVVTAGRYHSQSDAESALEDVAIYYPDAYIKYTGNRLIN